MGVDGRLLRGGSSDDPVGVELPRRTLTVAAAAAGFHSLLVGVVLLTFGDVLGDHDGLHFAALTLDPLLLDSPVLDHTTYRAMRIGMPLLAWPLSWLGPDVALAVVQVLGVGVGSWALSCMAIRRGLSGWYGLVFAVLPGTLISTRVLVADALAAAFMLAAVNAWESGRAGWLWALAAVLSKETMLFAVVGYALFDWRKAVAPLGAFGIWVASLLARFGWSSPDRTIGPPLEGFSTAVQVWWDNARSDEMAGGLLLVLLLSVVGWLAVRDRSPVMASAAGVCLLVPFLGFDALKHALHSQRFVLFPLTVVVLVVSANRKRPPARGRGAFYFLDSRNYPGGSSWS